MALGVQNSCFSSALGIPAPPSVHSEVERWFCEGRELQNSPDIQIWREGDLHTLVITEAFEDDTGRYTCVASNSLGADNTSAEVYIEEEICTLVIAEAFPEDGGLFCCTASNTYGSVNSMAQLIVTPGAYRALKEMVKLYRGKPRQ
ncbi:hypothetical protein GOODEAATRI_004281 [Goodea atripinnis]|uniref:Ig-like domain-containing protein n=1 Tax=Goodea atripinnis TaxID=208336 RepID=A0ABV0PVM8_9TELE